MASAGQSPNINYPALLAAIAKAMADIRANQALTPAPATTGAQIAAALPAIQADIALLATKIQAYPGVIRGVDDILTALEGDRMPWAADVKGAIDALPGGLAMVEQYLPMALSMLTMFSPATGSPWLGNPRLP